MNLGIIAYGGAGGRIADAFKSHETTGANTSLSEFVLLMDTYSGDLISADSVEDDWKVVYGKPKFDGRGAAGDLEAAMGPTENTKRQIKSAMRSSEVKRSKIDAYLVIGGLGGATGGSGAPLAAAHLSERVGATPVYGVGVLPAPVENSRYRINAARSIQSLSAETDSLFLFDNTVLDVAAPGSHPDVSDDTSKEEMYSSVNEKIATLLHTVFAADTRDTTGRYSTESATQGRVKGVLGTGGLTSFSFVEKQLPRIGRSGSAVGWAMRFCWGLLQTVDSSLEVSDWPHPAELTGHLTSTDSSLLRSVTPQDASRTLTLLTAPEWYLRPQHVSDTIEWAAQEFSPTDKTVVNADPRKYLGTVSALTVYSGFGIPPSVQQLLTEAEALMSQTGATPLTDPKSVSVFDDGTDAGAH